MKDTLANIDLIAAEQNAQSIGTLMAEAGETLGSYSVMSSEIQITAQSQIAQAISDAMKKGLTVEMLKAKTPCYIAFVESVQSVRAANDLTPLSDATRDNYLSRIRKFVSARGAVPLDLFGNAAAAKQKAERKVAEIKGNVIKVAKDKAVDIELDDSRNNSGDLDAYKIVRVEHGAPCLAAFLAHWVELNNGNTGLTKIAVMSKDLLNQINIAIGAKK